MPVRILRVILLGKKGIATKRGKSGNGIKAGVSV